MLGTVGIGGAAVAGAYFAGRASEEDGPPVVGPVPFHGAQQAGIATPQQRHLLFASLDLAAGTASELRELLREWTEAAAKLTEGALVGPTSQPDAAPEDPGEALGLGPAGLTLTLGLGSTVFTQDGEDRLGLGERMPPALAPLPAFPGEDLDPSRSHGDLCIQACAEDAQVAFHAVHALARLGLGVVVPRWAQTGFRSGSRSKGIRRSRNLLGFHDGTNNIDTTNAKELDTHVWARPTDAAPWMAGGTYVVTRRIRMLFDVWDATSLREQEATIGRHKESGAPLGETTPNDPVDLATPAGQEPAVPLDAHIRLASPKANDGAKLLRRSYSFADAVEPDSGHLDAGLFFICFQRDPQRQFVPIQKRLATDDALAKHLLHTGSGLFACPPGAKPGGFIGEGLFA